MRTKIIYFLVFVLLIYNISLAYAELTKRGDKEDNRRDQLLTPQEDLVG